MLEMFVEMMVAAGFEAWYETEAMWDEWAEAMIAAGYDVAEVGEFFDGMAEDL